MTSKTLIMALAIFLGMAVIVVPFVALAYGPWLVWVGLVFWLGWTIPTTIQPTHKPIRDAGRRFALGSVVITLASLPIVYLIATAQFSAFGGEGFQWAEPQVLIATVVFLAPSVYVPLLAVRCLQMYWREHQGPAQ